MMYPTNPCGCFNPPEASLEPPDCREPDPTPPPEPKLFQPLEQYTLSEIKAYCEEWGEYMEESGGCHCDGRCAFYKFCEVWPCDWKGI